MAGGGFTGARVRESDWPTAEFGAMGLEGADASGLRRELEAIQDPGERQAAYETAVAAAYERGQGINMAAYGRSTTWSIRPIPAGGSPPCSGPSAPGRGTCPASAGPTSDSW